MNLPVPDSNGPDWAVFLDVDGTLLNLAEHPDDVLVPDGLLSLLICLKRALNGAVALVSGRSLASLDALLGAASLDVAGCHGAEIRLNGQASLLGSADAVIPKVAERLAMLSDGIPLSMVELKTHSIAFHYRHQQMDALQARQLALKAIAGQEGRLRLLDGKQVVEILPQGVGKGAAISHFLEHPPFKNRLPVFVGDDVTDEEGFLEVNKRGGISIHVGSSDSTLAQYKAVSVAEIAEWLAGPVCRSLEYNQRKDAS
ncbi:trehalose-6-phosphate phosphatase, biosynthetic [Rhodospirillaceae bacterium LM-1]|nr:trehalose-6-phosphate phosphatase, biosynthetic [Rhodospirillaceae bacterium LM-1]